MAEEKKPGFGPEEEKGPGQEEKREDSMLRKETGPAAELAPERKEGLAEKDDSYSKILAKVKSGSLTHDEASIKDDAFSVSEEDNSESKINNLVNLALQKGVIHAVKVARHLEDNYALDEMHDRLLADDLHDALVKKGLLKEV